MDKQEYFPVIRLCRDDLIECTDDEKLKERIDMIPDYKMEYLARKIGDFIFDGDVWNDACREAIHLIEGEVFPREHKKTVGSQCGCFHYKPFK